MILKNIINIEGIAKVSEFPTFTTLDRYSQYEVVEPFCTFIEAPLKIPVGTNTLQLLQTLGITLNDVLVGKPNVLIEYVTVSLLDPRTIEKCTVLSSGQH
ncbi:hypothetical protein Calkro_0379 [Caldicellulosiruptor kronotskyensis 2002]|uniref:SipL SPOCS domain-containing protein n=1 Tax=Caldicellulosiruptor kronotskyensis (strain DSM 18902 / VKM B-2412 / 2002) TaxID=632348 RepID=E4SDZ5_CALK2|nr:hypothetical protein [Caldicellulosiruptor kronotskyensis]ADQ45282.1 hypothetical protein Calkro_0379 [Caldicellulosiruptor kronotskyensis 2002]